MSPWQEHCEGKKDLESFVKSVEEFADSLYTVIADRAGKRSMQYLYVLCKHLVMYCDSTASAAPLLSVVLLLRWYTMIVALVLHAGEGVPDPPRLNFPERASIQEQFEDRVPVVETATVSAGWVTYWINLRKGMPFWVPFWTGPSYLKLDLCAYV